MSDTPALKPARTRYAPSPTGRTHLGNLRTAMFAWLWARHTGGQFLLRIEDTDRERYVEGAQEELMAALRWLGLEWDEGPDKPNGKRFIQSQNLARYQAVAQQLVAAGHAYYCDCTPERLEIVRRTQQARGQQPRYDNHCRNRGLTAGVVRLKLPEAGTTVIHDELRGSIPFENADIGDPILLKSDGFPTYHLAATVDDHDMAITHVIRGEEWLSSTPIHVNLYLALGWTPPSFTHTPLVTDFQGKKIKKRDDGQPRSEEYAEYVEMLRVATLQARGYLPEAVFNFLAFLGWHPGTTEEIMTRDQLISKFSLSRLSSSPGVFDVDRLNWFNQQHLKLRSNAELAVLALPYLKSAHPNASQLADSAWLERLIGAVRDEVVALEDVVEVTQFAFVDPSHLSPEVSAELATEAAKVAIHAFVSALPAENAITAEAADTLFKGLRDQLKQSHKLNGKQVMMPIRIALTGMTGGAHLTDILPLIGVEASRRRAEQALSAISA